METNDRRDAYVCMSPAAFQDFDTVDADVGETHIFLRRSGSGPPILLLHGFPQTHLMWREVAPLLARDFKVVCADLRGYGRSGCPASPRTMRPMPSERWRGHGAVMERLGFRRFWVAGHDRGGRVAYRMALDHPDRVDRLAVLDILPTADAWSGPTRSFATAYWPWSLLAQPEPLPERMLAAAPDAIVDNALGDGASGDAFDPEVRAAYIDALRDPARVHAICEEYRAAATLDHEHDAEDRRAGRRIACPCLCSGAAEARWIAGMPTRAALLPCGEPGQMMFAVQRSMRVTSFRRKFRNERRRN